MIENIKNSVREFISSKFNIALVIILIILGAIAININNEPNQVKEEKFTVHFFYLPTCPHCNEQKPIIYELQKEMPEIEFVFHDVSKPQEYDIFYKMAAEAGLNLSNLGVPTLIIGKEHKSALVGFHNKEEIKAEITKCYEACKKSESIIKEETKEKVIDYTKFNIPFLGETDLTKMSLPMLAILLGLVDGFNPCAMWVLVYLISLALELNDRRKLWLIVGSFVIASGVLYFLFMTAWLNVFLFVGYIRIVSVIIGLIAVGGGVLGLKEYITTKGALECKVGDEKSHKNTINLAQEIITKPISLGIIISIIALAFIVNSVEFLCSSAIPAVFTQILALANISIIERYFYIALYDIFYMLDDLIIFSIAAFAISSSFGEKYAKQCKLIGGVILIILGIIILFAPQLLR